MMSDFSGKYQNIKEELEMTTADLARKINLLSQEPYQEEENFADQLFRLSRQVGKEKEQAFYTFMEKMEAAEKSLREQGEYSEEEVEEELSRI